ncbi:MAG: RNA polymerase sigma factor RpoH [Pelagibacteraceae bacterium]|nr:RNA polymerase sigma factor RpoH [Pelagibacteraceae bacterium]PPR33113.1 MAG: RNA polymerase sigma factor RpoH [Alphaproteobacteria bacterium MarineAlpha6_Bin5]|tara:strand:+ start:443 stop:1378 length:936 start_codon:yes stop_codon:yes gene_type:complete
MATTSLPTLTSSGISQYLTAVSKYPILTEKDEYMLAKRWQTKGDAKAARKLITSHLRLVAKIAFGYRGYKLPIEDLISEGNVGLMKAVKKFDPDKGFRLSTYAIWWIKASINEFILNSWSLVKLGTTAAQKKLFFNLQKLKNQMNQIEKGELPVEIVKKIAKKLSVNEKDVIEMNRRLSGPEKSLNAPISDEDGTEAINMLKSNEDNQEKKFNQSEEKSKRKELLIKALEDLNEREKNIFVKRCLNDPPSTLETLSKIYKVSRERIRQIEVRAFEKVKKIVLETAISESKEELYSENSENSEKKVTLPLEK